MISPWKMIVMGLAALGSIRNGDAEIAFCSQWAHCTSVDSCTMSGKINDFMEPLYAVANNTEAVPFESAQVFDGIPQCQYGKAGPKVAMAAFQQKTNGTERLIVPTSKANPWWGQGLGTTAFCNGNNNGTNTAKRCFWNVVKRLFNEEPTEAVETPKPMVSSPKLRGG